MVNNSGRIRYVITISLAISILMIVAGSRQTIGLFVGPIAANTAMNIAQVSMAVALVQPLVSVLKNRYADKRRITMPLLKEPTYYTYNDFLSWDEKERAELINGEVVMLGAPTSEHQLISMELSRQLSTFLLGKPCKVFAAPYAVRLNPQNDDRDDTVLEPDLAVVCDASKIESRGCRGAPDMVIEIVSPSSASYDRVVKFRKYQQGKVREYWIVDPETKTVQVCILANDEKTLAYRVTIYDDTETVPVSVLPGCEVHLNTIFAGLSAPAS